MIFFFKVRWQTAKPFCVDFSWSRMCLVTSCNSTREWTNLMYRVKLKRSEERSSFEVCRAFAYESLPTWSIIKTQELENTCCVLHVLFSYGQGLEEVETCQEDPCADSQDCILAQVLTMVGWVVKVLLRIGEKILNRERIGCMVTTLRAHYYILCTGAQSLQTYV